jgi:predicted RNase H-like nuclease (RuvC/YqgF family)
VNLFDHGVVPAVVATIAWLIRGRYEKDSAAVKQARSVLDMWQRTASRQDEQLEALREHVQRLESKIVLLERTISELTAENQALKATRQ